MLTCTDLFAGFGGASTGAISVPGVEISMAANHWQLAVDVHNANHQNTDHACVDLHMEDPAYFPKTDLLWASPECTKWSQAGAGKNARKGSIPGDWNLFSEIDEDLLTTDDDEATRSRLLMFDVLRFIDHHRYAGVIVENVVDIATNAKYAAAWRAWQQGLINLGYDYKVVSLNSMHAQAVGMPAPQSRDRLYVVAWPKGNRAPDIERFIRPQAYCAACESVVESEQAWKNGRTVGKYRTQYVYLCRHCKSQVEPGWLPASTAIDWMLKGTRIGDREKPLSEKTRARIAAGIARYWRPLVIEANGNQYDAADPRHRNHGDPNAYYRTWPTTDPLKSLLTQETKALVVPVEGRDGKRVRGDDEAFRTLTTRAESALVEPAFMTEHRFEYRTRDVREAMATLAAQGNHIGLVQPFIAELRGGSSDARSTGGPLSTITASGNHHALLTPYYGASKGSRPVDEPIGTLTTHDRYALIQRHNTGRGDQGQMLTPVHEQLRTLTSKGHQSLVTPGDIEAAEAMVDDCTFRMLQPHEIGAGMAFPSDYIVHGSKRDQVKGYGNAVTPPAARDLVGALAESLGHEVAA